MGTNSEKTVRLKVKVGSEGWQELDVVDSKLVKLDKTATRTAKGMQTMNTWAQRGMKALKALALTVAIVTAAITPAIAATVEFDRGLASVATMLDKTTMGQEAHAKTVAKYRKEVKALAVALGEDTDVLLKGLYDLLSASVPAEKAMDVLAVATKAAKAGMTDASTAVDFLTSAMNAFGYTADSAGAVADIAFAAVARGKTTFAELAQNIGKVAPMAASLGVELDQLAAMIANLTRQGINTEQATTALNQFFLTFIKGSDQANKAWAEVSKGTDLAGTSFNKALIQGDNLFKTLAVLTKASDEQKRAMFAESTALLALNALLKDSNGLKSDYARTTNAAGETDRAFAEMVKTLGHQFDRLKALGKVLLIEVGERLAPKLGEIADKVLAWYKANEQLVGSNIDKWVGLVGDAFVAAAKFASTVAPLFEGLVTGWNSLPDVVKVFGLVGAIAFGTTGKLILVTITTAIGLIETLMDKTDEVNQRAKFDPNRIAVLEAQLERAQKQLQDAEAMLDFRKKEHNAPGIVAATREVNKLESQIGSLKSELSQAAETAKKFGVEIETSAGKTTNTAAKAAASITKLSTDLAVDGVLLTESVTTATSKETTARVKAHQAMQDKIKKLTMSATAYEIDQIQQRYLAAVKAGDNELEARALMYLELAEISKKQDAAEEASHETKLSMLGEFVKRWTDVSTNMYEAAKNALESIQGAFSSFFQNLFEDGSDAFDSLWNAFKNIGYQALGQVASVMAMNFVGSGLSSIFPSLMTTTTTTGSAAQNAASGGTNLLMGGGSGMLDSAGSWLVETFGTAGISPVSGPELLGIGAGGWSAALGAAGWGALGGGLLSPLVYGGKGYSTIGGTAGAALGTGAASLLASAGLISGGPLGLIAGGLIGGLAGGGLGSLFGDDEDSDAETALAYFAQNLEKITSGQDGGLAWLDAINQYEQSQNKAREQYGELQEIYKQLRAAGQLEWWAPDYYTGKQLGHLDDENFWKVASLGGGLQDYAEFEDLQEVLGTLEEQLGPLTEGLRNVFDGLDLASMGAEELAAVVEERLNPAYLIQNQLQQDLADGVDKLSAHQKALNTTINTLLSTVDLSSAQQDELIDLLMRESGSVADLTAKYERYNQIQELLANAHNMTREEVAALVEEGRSLHQSLGLETTSMSDLNSTMQDLVDTLKELANLSKNDLSFNFKFNSSGSVNSADYYHSGGMIPKYHSGGFVGAALAAGLITEHGGALPRMHSGGLRPDERLIIAQAGEFMIQQRAVQLYGAETFEAYNEGRVPLVESSYSPRGGDGASYSGGSVFQGGDVNVEMHITIEGDVIGEKGVIGRIEQGAGQAIKRQVFEELKEGTYNCQKMVHIRGVQQEGFGS